MSQVWHLFRNDLRASKYILTVWIGSLAAYVAAAWKDPLTQETNIHASAIGALTMVAAVVIAAIVIQQDSLVGARAFWMTRPISWWALLGSKALFVVAFLIGAQFIACLALLLRLGAPPDDLPAILFKISASWIWILAVAVVLATVTAGAAQFITAALVAYVATLWATLNVALLIQGVRYDYDFFSEAVLPICLGLIALRYAGLSRWKTVAAIVACWTALILLPLTGWTVSIEHSQPAATPLTGVSLHAGTMNPGEEGYQAAFHSGGDVRSEGFVVRWEATGLGANQALRLDDLHGQVTWDDGEVTRIEGQMLGTVRGAGPIASIDLSGRGDRPVSVVILDRIDKPERVYGKRGKLEARLTGWLQTIEEYGASPVVPRATVDGNGYAVRIESVSIDDTAATILFRERRIAGADENADWPQPIIFHRESGVRLHETGANRYGSEIRGRVTGWPVIGIRERERVYKWERQAAEIVESGPEWLDSAEVAVVGYSPERRVTMDLEIPDFRIIRNQALERRSRMTQQQGISGR